MSESKEPFPGWDVICRRSQKVLQHIAEGNVKLHGVSIPRSDGKRHNHESHYVCTSEMRDIIDTLDNGSEEECKVMAQKLQMYYPSVWFNN